MTELFKQIADLMTLANTPKFVPGVAQNLMEQAEAEAGRNPFEAAELRTAARAFLSVIR